MRFAIISDIHGNSDALEAVLSDIDALGISNVVNLGDHLSGPLDAVATIELLMERSYPSIRGNHDRLLIEQDPTEMGASDRAAFEQLAQHHLDWLKSLPSSLTLFDEVLLCHGTPSSDVTYWLEKVEVDGRVRSATIEEIEAEAAGLNAKLLLCGHTHVPRCVRLRDGRLVLNPGSVGCPGYDDDTPVYHQMQTGTPNASYAIAEMSSGDWLITFRSVPYDNRRMVRLAKQMGRTEWAEALATGRIGL
ncbi:metallophosphoesterase family protein [uncultured Roseibium sp.]|uniref:metallophosphoesterase family protein n=1 Tax=uncultured Roseibium sp. TaxID=1936171 RepID=UPI002618C1E6|nr:metallophosphoesterase family protein [uncultured Roseibium sp.]